jgi:hypothetical protein
VDYKVANSLICDTQTQLERFVALFSGDTQAAIVSPIDPNLHG